LYINIMTSTDNTEQPEQKEDMVVSHDVELATPQESALDSEEGKENDDFVENPKEEEESIPASVTPATSAESDSKETDRDVENQHEESLSESFPAAFYCPITKKVFEDPVVACNGITYERSAIEEQEINDVPSDKPLYQNRSLKSIIEEVQLDRASSGLKRFVRHLLTHPDRPLPDGYYCPITLNMMHVPVVDPEGYSFEKVAIEGWINVNGNSPVTRQTITIDSLYPNHTLVALMTAESKKSDGDVHPGFLQWREESGPPAFFMQQRGDEPPTPVASFPTTPEQLEAFQQARELVRLKRRTIGLVLFLLLAIAVWLVPVLATVILVLILICVACVGTRESANNNQF